MTISEGTKLHHPSKRLGQNFLIDTSFARRVVNEGLIEREETVLEPGAGYGIVTRLIAENAGKVLAVEKDRRLAQQLKEIFQGSPRVLVLEGDVLKLDLPSFDKIVGTPPYYISSRLILLMLRRRFLLASLVFQEEFGQRLVAQPGAAAYGRLSVMAQQGLIVQLLEKIPRHAFSPKPKVDSILLTVRKSIGASGEASELFRWVVRELFTQRRRLVRGAFKHALEKRLGKDLQGQILGKISLPDRRVFQLSVGEFEALSFQLGEALREEKLEKEVLTGIGGRVD